MEKKGKVLVGCLLVSTLLLTISVNLLSSQKIPEIFHPNPSLTFDKKEIGEWVEEHNWQQAYKLVKNTHSKTILEGTRYLGGTRIVLEAEGIEDMNSDITTKTINKIITILKNRIYQYDLMEAVVRPLGERRVEVKVPGIIDQEAARKTIGRTALLEFQKVIKTGAPGTNLTPNNLSQEVIYGRPNEDGERRPYLVQKEPLMTGKVLKDAKVKTTQSSRNPIIVSLQLTKEGKSQFADVITSLEPEDDRLAIVLDKIVQTAPVISQEFWDQAKRTKTIQGATIAGDFTAEQAKRLAIVLRAGTLPAEIDIVEQKEIEKEERGTAFEEDTIRATVTLYTPLLTWVEQNYKGKVRFWNKEKIRGEYQETVTPPSDGARFQVKIKTKDKAELKKENLRFVLEDKSGNRWETKRVEFGGIKERQSIGSTTYERGIDVWFSFANNKQPSWLELNLYIVRMDIIGRDKIPWTFYGIRG